MMELLRPYLEELRLGIIVDPHTSRTIVLTEKVTVCPSCRSLHTLRQHEGHVYCTDCDWTTRERVTPLVA